MCVAVFMSSSRVHAVSLGFCAIVGGGAHDALKLCDGNKNYTAPPSFAFAPVSSACGAMCKLNEN